MAARPLVSKTRNQADISRFERFGALAESRNSRNLPRSLGQRLGQSLRAEVGFAHSAATSLRIQSPAGGFR